MDQSGARVTTVAAPAKRPHDPTDNEGDKPADGGVEEPPAKAGQSRRPTLRPTPNLAAGKRVAEKAPPLPPQQNQASAPDGSGYVAAQRNQQSGAVILLPATVRCGRTNMSSGGAAIAALAGRGNRLAADADKEYEIVLPTLPTRRVLNTVFLHGDVRERPYRVKDFRDALANAGALPDVVALGAYQINHVWAVTHSSAEATKKLAALKELQVKGRRCIIFDPEDQQVKRRLHWMLHGVADEDIRTAFAAFGNVTEVTRERWRVQGMKEKGSTTRTVLLKLKPGMKVDDLPHQLRVAGELALVLVPGRPMQCLRCHGTGHVRRDCKVPRCSQCRRYGHADVDFVRTYASATGLGKANDTAELMDVAEAEEAATGTDEAGKSASTLATCSNDPNKDDHGKSGACNTSVTPPVTTPAKRPRDQTSPKGDKVVAPGVEEPPAKISQSRRPKFRPRPNLSDDKRAGDKVLLEQADVLPPDDTGGNSGV
ncbi:uncharacterized protein LOC144126366 [Amblyomma americanum]